MAFWTVRNGMNVFRKCEWDLIDAHADFSKSFVHVWLSGLDQSPFCSQIVSTPLRCSAQRFEAGTQLDSGFVWERRPTDGCRDM